MPVFNTIRDATFTGYYASQTGINSIFRVFHFFEFNGKIIFTLQRWKSSNNLVLHKFGKELHNSHVCDALNTWREEKNLLKFRICYLDIPS
jgi:hypothetical protein